MNPQSRSKTFPKSSNGLVLGSGPRNEKPQKTEHFQRLIVVPVEGLEPPTYRLQGGCSTS